MAEPENDQLTAERLALRRRVNPAARRYLLRGLIEALPASGWWTKPEREEWHRLMHFLVDWLIVTEED